MSRKAKERRRRFGKLFSRKSVEGVVTWYAQRREGPRGRRVTRAIASGEGGEKAAGDFLDTIEARLRLGSYAPPPTAAQADAASAVPFAPALPTFVDYSQRQLGGPVSVKAPPTRACYAAAHKALAAYFGGRSIETEAGARKVPAKRLDEFTVHDAADYRVWRRSRRFVEHRRKDDTPLQPRPDAPAPTPVSASTVNRDLQYASMILNAAVRDGLLKANPLEGLKMEREERRVRRYLAKGEVSRLILACDEWLRPYVLAGLFTGCRGKELRALTWADVNLDEGKLAIYRTKVRRGDHLDLHPVLAEELRRLRASRPGGKLSDRVFLNRCGKPYVDVRKAWARAVKAAGLDGRAGLTPNSVRHTFATHFLEGGGAITDLMAQLGHSKLATTQVYAAMVNERRRATVLRLNYGALTARAPAAKAGAESNSESNSTAAGAE